MPETFYHVDRHTNLEVGDTMELEWPGTLIDNWVNTPSSTGHLESLMDLYPEGISRHGARYAHPRFLSEDMDGLPEGWMATTGSLEVTNPESGETGSNEIVPYIVKYEQYFELLRMLEFNEKRSRFQSFFAFETLDGAIEFHNNHRSESVEQILKVECNDYEIRDMDLISFDYFGEMFSRGRKYWKGESGSDDPTWEVAMQPPIEVLEVAEEEI